MGWQLNWWLVLVTVNLCVFNPKTNTASDFIFSIINSLATVKLKAELKIIWLPKLSLRKFSI